MSNRLIIEVLRCANHPSVKAIAVGDGEGTSTRVTSSRCCKQWMIDLSFHISANEARLLSDALNSAIEECGK